jgi:ribosome-binding factor A
VAIPFRREKLAAQIQKEVAEVLRREMRDPRVGSVTITRVVVSPDFKYAKVFLAALGNKKKVKLALGALKHAQGFLQKELGRRLRLRETPELSFREDEAMEKGFKMDTLFRQAAATSKTPEDGERAAEEE